MRYRLLMVGVVVWLCGSAPLSAQEEAKDSLAEARKLERSGRHEEALAALDRLDPAAQNLDDQQVNQAAILRTDCLEAIGKTDEAAEWLRERIGDGSSHPGLLARLGGLEIDRGRFAEGKVLLERAVEAEPDHLQARFALARLAAAQGRDTPDDWRYFIDHFNQDQEALATDPAALLCVGQAAEAYYWSRAEGAALAEGLNDVINGLYENAIKQDPACWEAAWLQGRLFLKGHRAAAARKELNRALLINPSAAEVIVDLGRLDLGDYKLAEGRRRASEALEIKPDCIAALVLLADLSINDERYAEAEEAARKALVLNPNSSAALARLAAAQILQMDLAGAAQTELRARAVSPRPTEFLTALGERLADRRKYHAAERAYLEAIALARQPDRVFAEVELGMLYMQIGREAEARALFDHAIAAHPFQDNVRLTNMLKVLEHLDAYETIESEHYRVSYLPDQDALLARSLSRYLESMHADLAARLGFEPPELSHVEIMQNHQWFSGRTLGLPFVPTVGACTGKVVALASPAATNKPFNWSRVMIHEITHVITLQQTNFNIPHWFTEALAVESEASPRPQAWNTLLLERVPNRQKLHDLESINLGFIRPEEPDDRQMAYCQAQLYAQYMTKRYGKQAIPDMLDAYRRGLTTAQAIPACFEIPVADFEAGYLEFLDEVVGTISARVENDEPISFSTLARLLAQRPDDPDLNARMAYEHYSRRDLKAARPFADRALEFEAHQPLASYVKAKLYQAIGDEASAIELLRPALDPANPNQRVLDLLAELEMKQGGLDEALRLYELARLQDPQNSKWIAGLARVHLRQDDRGKLLADLALLADLDADDLDLRRNLTQEYLKREDFKEASRWAMECLYIDVNDPEHHVWLGDARVGTGEPAGAVEEYEVALSLEPENAEAIRQKLAAARNAAGIEAEAR